MAGKEASTAADLSGKVMLITGATSGLGLATAEGLAAAGAHVILGARSAERGAEAAAQVTSVTGSREVEVVVADLSSRAGVDQMVTEVLERYNQLDVLVNNAGVDVGQRQVTPDGLELTFAVNYMAPFLITNGLLGLLRASAPARVLNVASGGYKGGKLDLEDLQSERHFNGQRAYNSSKLALILFTYELARRLNGTAVTANAVDPGFVRGTQIGGTLPFGYQVLGTLMWPFMAPVKKGAETAVWAASDPSLEASTGRYFKRCQAIETDAPTHDQALARQLWLTTEQLAGLDGDVTSGPHDRGPR